MVALLLGIMFLLLAFNFPMIIPMVVAPLVVMKIYISNVDIMLAMQQLIAGVNTEEEKQNEKSISSCIGFNNDHCIPYRLRRIIINSFYNSSGSSRFRKRVGSS